MSKIIDITDKLNFEERPKMKVKDTEVTANNDALTVLKVIALFDDEEGNGVSVKNMLKIFTLLFDEEEQKKVEALKLSFEDFSTFINETANTIINGNEDTEGETATPATT